MKLTIHVHPDVARALRENGHQPGADALRAVARDLDASLEPVHPGATDPDLATAFVLDLADAADAAQVVTRLRALPSVEAAYVKPADEPPDFRSQP